MGKGRVAASDSERRAPIRDGLDARDGGSRDGRMSRDRIRDRSGETKLLRPCGRHGQGDIGIP